MGTQKLLWFFLKQFQYDFDSKSSTHFPEASC